MIVEKRRCFKIWTPQYNYIANYIFSMIFEMDKNNAVTSMPTQTHAYRLQMIFMILGQSELSSAFPDY